MKKIVNKSEYMPRIIDPMIERYLSTFSAVCIEGPKWCGKTWSSSFHSKSEVFLEDPAGNFNNRRLAEISPELILDGETPRLIDEWQEVPAIWDAVRFSADKKTEKGQFILSGSSTPVRKGILHSGAGRIGKLRMRTMSLYETGDSGGEVSLEKLCNGELRPTVTGEVQLSDLAYYVVRGGFPANLNVEPENASLIPKSYIESILSNDTQRIDDKKYDIHKMRLLLHSLARNESTLATKNKLLSDIKETSDEAVDKNTIAAYLDVFDRLFLTDNQPPFSSNIRSSVRIKQSEKRHLCDPSLACALLNATPGRLTGDLMTFGFMFEALAEHDLRIYAESFGAKLFHYNDYKNREIDAVIELPDGKWCAFEIKLGANQIDKAAASLISLKESILDVGGDAPSVCCVICGLSDAAYVRNDGVFVVPLTALKN